LNNYGWQATRIPGNPIVRIVAKKTLILTFNRECLPMNRIMPPGYLLHNKREQIVEELRQKRADELFHTSAPERKRIEKEIYREPNWKLNEMNPRSGGYVLW